MSIKAVPGETLPKGRALSGDEIAALMDACARDRSAAGARDAAMFAIMRAAGLRRAEVSNLELADFDQRQSALVVKGKLNKDRLVPLSPDAGMVLKEWLKVRGTELGALFCRVKRNGVVSHNGRLTPQAIYKCLGKRAREAGVTNLSPHDFRRTFVSDLLDAGADIAVVQKLAGHSNVQTTARYDRRGDAAQRRAVALLKTPYRRQE